MEEKERIAVGKASFCLKKPVYILESASVVGKKEGDGPLGKFFDEVYSDAMLGCETWEEAESRIQQETVGLAIKKAGLVPEDIRYIFAGDLLGQNIATSFGVMPFHIPLFGLYGACSTCGEAISLGAFAVGGGFADKVVCVTSSHFASAEKEFRYPLEYGNQRPPSSTWTVTGSGAFILSETPPKNKTVIAIEGITTGRIIDSGLKDSMNMGACMAPAACDTIARNLNDFCRKPEEYDKIITGDLGSVGQTVLFRLLEDKGYHIDSRHTDCGMKIFDSETQGTDAGGSGCGCAASVLSAYILPKMREKEWKKVLFVPTGALLNKTSFNEGKTVPGIAHAVVLSVREME